MATANDVLKIAASQVGTRENPMGSNKQKYGVAYGWNAQPWCNMFIWWCAKQAGAEALVGKYAYVPYQWSFFKGRGRLVKDPKPGDIGFLKNLEHIVYVASVTTTTVTSIEGNYNNMVARVTRSRSSFEGFARPAYSAAPAPKPTPKPAPKPVTPKAPTGSVDALARAVIAGKYGTGDARRKALGSRYAEVQTRVNQLLAAPKGKTVDQLAREVIAGKHGTGAARQKALGSQYAAVQARVNQLLRGK